MNFAICISGELRTAYSAWASNLEKLTDQTNNYTYFFETWAHNSNPRIEDSFFELFINVFLGLTKTYKKFEAVDAQKIYNLFGDKRNFHLNIRQPSDWEKESLKILNLPPGRLGRKILGSLRMFFMIEKCDLMRIEYEKKVGRKFDAVMRVRPDSLLNSNLFKDFTESNLDLMFLNDPNGDRFLWGPVNDQIFIGNSHIMGQVSSAYTKLVEKGNSSGWMLPPGEIHEVLVAESALSWHIRELRHQYKVGSIETESILLRPKKKIYRIDSETRIMRTLEFPSQLKHFVKKFLCSLLSKN